MYFSLSNFRMQEHFVLLLSGNGGVKRNHVQPDANQKDMFMEQSRKLSRGLGQ